MNKLLVKGQQNFLGFNIPVIEGGFGEGQKVILAKTVAEIHEMEVKHINELINNNIDEFEFGVDILDLKGSECFKVVTTDLGIKVSNRTKNFYLLSEQGYMTLVMLMRTDKAKEIRKQLRREYFAMREIIQSSEQLKAQLLLNIYKGGQAGIIASKQLTEMEVGEATAPLIDTIEKQAPKVKAYDKYMDSDGLYSTTNVAKMLGFKRSDVFKFLRYKGFVFKNKVEATVKGITSGYFKQVVTPQGYSNMKVTPAGIEYIRNNYEEVWV